MNPSAERYRFLLSVSHSLQTPLTAVLGFAESLRSDTGTMNESERAELLATIADQAAVMSYLVQDFLAGAEAEIGVLSVASVPVNLRAQLAQVVERTRTGTGISLQVEGTATALGDPSRVRQIIRNLLRNAERHGGPNIVIRLSDHQDPALLTVADDGPAIPLEDQQRIFEPFEVAHHDEAMPDPVGLGLSVARELARLMDGDIDYRHARGHSRFTLSLPAHRATPKGEHEGNTERSKDVPESSHC